jgi:putative hydrolase of the HAD superfamily
VTEWWAQIVRPTLEQGSSREFTESMVSGLYDYFSGAEPYQLDSAVDELFLEWKKKGFNIGILSNSDPRLRQVVKDFDLEKFLYSPDAYSISYEVDYEKPDMRIFKDAEERLKQHLAGSSHERVGFSARTSAASGFWHVGDDLDKDFYGALGAGWNAVLIDKSRKYLENPNPVLKGMRDGDVVENIQESVKLIKSTPMRIICDTLDSLHEVFDS